jgi:8-oxo-dGTP diphosphatase
MKKVNQNSLAYQKIDLRRGVDYIGVTCVFFCHDGNGKLLMNKRSNKCRDEIGRWDVGGGSMEFGEAFEEAVKREIKEEYGSEPIDLKLVGPHNSIRKNGDTLTHWVAIVFVAQLEPSQVKIGDPEKMDEIGWFSLDNLPDPLHSEVGHFLENVKDHIMPAKT